MPCFLTSDPIQPKEMETIGSNPKNNPKKSGLPRRGQIKIDMMNKARKSIASVVSAAVRLGPKSGENGRTSLSSSFSTTPKASLSPYNSEAQSDA
ncbi:hypothetical protein RHMOL_Rhmol13G0111000 [Rhododendron molle]|uniref:Uncharacterized protein n=1 Tax=Rhododendron molle TaxID=49168 RepID=A0ACC0L6H3_RHOML|nr:hypothetical protein RHMOL_Rhmol13G0111000 [Rhododendron molle]